MNPRTDSGFLLQTSNLTCVRDGRLLFSELALSVGPGDCVELTGPNGSGKSTLLRIVAGLYPDYDGAVESSQGLYVGHKSGISLLLSPLENLLWYQRLSGTRADLGQALETVGLAGYEKLRCQNLSAGQQRRAALARLLVCNSGLWLLDEPFTALDLAGQTLVRELVIEHLARDGAAVCATHQALDIPGAAALELGRV